MHRRDLLLFRTASGVRVVELACERLYMHYLDSRGPGPSGPPLPDYWLGEPEPHYAPRRAGDLFDGLRRDLAGARFLRVIDERWLADPDLRREVDALVAGFIAGGGQVEFVAGAAASS